MLLGVCAGLLPRLGCRLTAFELQSFFPSIHRLLASRPRSPMSGPACLRKPDGQSWTLPPPGGRLGPAPGEPPQSEAVLTRHSCFRFFSGHQEPRGRLPINTFGCTSSR